MGGKSEKVIPYESSWEWGGWGVGAGLEITMHPQVTLNS